ncbi:hypothetical protein CAI21_08315 [Alkalilimnicola ehrlichii]|uniref:Uncharacterized protein n=1 Tax=Alkalilimnicola ehrlichii TaxID=351052 RepID=A0A3E0WVJ4_9GAMM|nr:hypothetical protein [Alkalilimnicola ehrlichii]RFA29831.1 hypothetical protein CAI21_08315 [Alkalilimnicola ehrlichii]RFA36419.1 hypothetical protein CAL65_10585 [Alkalilimnicola ehrlichii]
MSAENTESNAPSQLGIGQFLCQLGVLRLMLLGASLFTVFMVGLVDTASYESNWDLFRGGVVPAMAPILFLLIMFDVLMAKVWKSEAKAEADTEAYARWTRIIWTDLAVAGLMLLAWGPFFYQLFSLV